MSHSKPLVPVYQWPNTDKSKSNRQQSSAAAASASQNADTSESSGHDESSSDTDNDQQQAARPMRHHGMPSIRPNASRNRQRQLEALKRYEARLKSLANHRNIPPSVAPINEGLVKYQSVMYLHRLDVTQAISDLTVSWQELCEQYQGSAPEETIFYSLVAGRGELIFFGGILCDLKTMSLAGSFQSVCNSVHIVTFPRTLK